MKAIASFLSWVFLPLFTPMYALLIVFFLPTQPKSFYLLDSLFHYPAQAKLLYLLLFLVFIVLAPGMSLIVLRLNKSISSLSLPTKEERRTPITIMIFYTAVLYGFMIYQDADALVPTSLKGMALGGFLGAVLAFFINFKLKISLHGLGIGALIGFIYVYFMGMESFSVWVFLLLIILGSTALSARVFLKAHDLKQILLGVLIGFGTQYFCVYFYPF